MEIKKIYIGGNVYGAGNIGDDAVLLGIYRLLADILPEVEVTVGTMGGQTLNFLPEFVQYIDSFEFVKVRNVIADCDLFIVGGGTMIGDELGINFPLRHSLKLLATAKYLHKKTCMFAVGANRLQTKKGKKFATSLLKLSDFVSLRDTESYEVCNGTLGVNVSNIRTTIDPAFSLAPKASIKTEKVKKAMRRYTSVFGVNVVNEVWKDEKKYKKAIADTCNYLAKEYNLTPVFFSTEIRPGNLYDNAANIEVTKQLECDFFVLEPEYYSPEEMIEIISFFKFTLAMRMHALIFSSLANVPFVSISRVDKVDNFMRLFNRAASGSITSCSSSQLIDDIKDILENSDFYRWKIQSTLSSLKKKNIFNRQLLLDLPNSKPERKLRFLLKYYPYVICKSSWMNKLFSLLRGEITLKSLVLSMINKL
jgi:polysaccharide pyruvyl transferase WcaK-like protein